MTTKCSRLLFCSTLALGLAAPALAWDTATGTLNDSEEPGSVLVFYRFQKGDIRTPDEGTQPRSQFKISVTCPNDVVASGVGCAETGDFASGQPVHLVAHWVCPPRQDEGTDTTCQEVDFPLNTTVFGTVEFDANGGEQLPQPPCAEGYLIVWVEDGFGHRIAFNGLIGTAVIRGSGTSWRAYNALPIQANPSLASGTTLSADALHFDGSDYQAITSTIYGGVAFPNTEQTKLVLLTLDVLSGQPNPSTDVSLRFYNEEENFVSDTVSFTCWGDFRLSRLAAGALGSDPFTEEDGLVRSTGSNHTLVGIVETSEDLTENIRDQPTANLSTTPLNPGTINPNCSVNGTSITGSCNASCTVGSKRICVSLSGTPPVPSLALRTSCVRGEVDLGPAPVDINCQITTDLLAPVELRREYTYPLLNDSIPVSTTFVPDVVAPPPQD